ADPRQLKDYLRHREMLARIANDKRQPEERRAQADRALAGMPCHFFEVKTLLVSAHGAVHMNKAARRRKERWQERYGAAFHVVAVDRRKGKKHSGHEVHVESALAGTLRLDQMDKVSSFAAVLSKVCPDCRSSEKRQRYRFDRRR